MNRKGEIIGWIGGWLGGFIWLGLLSVILLFQNRMRDGLIGIVIFAAAIITIIATAPWKHPNTKYWKLMLPLYLLFFISIALYIRLYCGLENTGLKWTIFLFVIPCLVPFATIGNRTWNSSA